MLLACPAHFPLPTVRPADAYLPDPRGCIQRRRLIRCSSYRHRAGPGDLLAHDQFELAHAQPPLVVAELPVVCDAEEVGIGQVKLGLERLRPTNTLGWLASFLHRLSIGGVI